MSGTFVGFDVVEIRATFGAMGRWTIKPSAWLVLMSLLFLIVLILVLPQVDLPDTAFHRGTAPVDVHARVTSAPGLLSMGTVSSFCFSAHTASSCREHVMVLAHASSSSLPLLHRALRC
jgi:hypothetical protein